MVGVDAVDPGLAAPSPATAAYGVKWDNVTTPSAPTLRFYWSSAAGTVPAEVTTATALTGVTCDLRVYGY
jgi:hypothetical protein